MTFTSRRLFLLGGLALGAAPLAGCDEMILAPPAEPPVLEPISYASRMDGSHRIAAVPYEQIPAWLHRQVVSFETEEAPGSIVIHSSNGLLHLVQPDGYAIRYGISVGRDGLDWRGTGDVYRRAHWPSWTPTPSMIAREPERYERYADGQPGGPTNPLGARALYLRTVSTGEDEGIRIHGTPEWRSIGRRASNGCFRMVQHDVIDLFDRVPNGTRVVVV